MYLKWSFFLVHHSYTSVGNKTITVTTYSHISTDPVVNGRSTVELLERIEVTAVHLEYVVETGTLLDMSLNVTFGMSSNDREYKTIFTFNLLQLKGMYSKFI